ncbi:MAG: bifunctional folylpolyglutamate synthase/dihydrofolate synthase [Planctomycetes bacterium]|nr:bifunctional folylpolyglutamate synthase/dihydrofolate synthase [Planctomycetota bacterium]
MAVTDTLNYESALAFLTKRINYEQTARIPYRSSTFKLRRMYDLLGRLGNPQDNLNVIHIAGTKGKGPTATMIAAILRETGYCTGLYTSPHLHRLEERANVDGAPCREEDLVARVSELMPVVAAMDREANTSGSRGPTFFELTTALAMLHFVRRQVDVAILEVGLGGRLDSTNVCRPLISVITSISYDHTEILGDTLAKIAREKAGIIKRSVPVVSGVTSPDAQSVVDNVARQRGCQLLQLGRDFCFDYAPPQDLIHGSGSSPLDYLGTMNFQSRELLNHAAYDRLLLAPLGRHQAANAAVALATVGQLANNGWSISETAIRRGLSVNHCPARIEIVSRRPTIVIDAAHNVASIEALLNTIDESLASLRRRTLIFATSKGKDVSGMLRQLLPKFQKVIFTRYQKNPRYVDPSELQRLAVEIVNQGTNNFVPPAIEVCTDPTASWRHARASAGEEDLICVAGSAFIAAEVRELLCPWLDSGSPDYRGRSEVPQNPEDFSLRSE